MSAVVPHIAPHLLPPFLATFLRFTSLQHCTASLRDLRASCPHRGASAWELEALAPGHHTNAFDEFNYKRIHRPRTFIGTSWHGLYGAGPSDEQERWHNDVTCHTCAVGQDIHWWVGMNRMDLKVCAGAHAYFDGEAYSVVESFDFSVVASLKILVNTYDLERFVNGRTA
jgi:hypothetical protein